MTEDQQERISVQDTIDEAGCQVMQILGDNYMPEFAYTIGLFQQFNHPEIICFGLSLDVMHTLLNNAKDRIEDGEVLEAGKSYTGFLEGDVQVHFLEVDKTFYKDYVGYGRWFYENDDFPLLQMVWPDKKGNFPWDKKFDKNIEFSQPLLDRDTDFFFYESKNLGVFATKQVLEGEPIRYVIHDDEGDWFFLENDEAENDDIQIVALEQITKLDPSINSIYYLQYGWEARRAEIGDEWDDTESELDDESEDLEED